MAANKRDVMLTYEWKSGSEYIEKLKKYLEAEGITYWHDRIEVYGDFLKRMAEGVHCATVIVPFISKRYQGSYNCQMEYQHAATLKKLIVPAKVEDYHPPGDSALGIIIAGKTYYKLYDDFDTEAKKLVEDIKETLLEATGGQQPEEDDELDKSTEDARKKFSGLNIDNDQVMMSPPTDEMDSNVEEETGNTAININQTTQLQTDSGNQVNQPKPPIRERMIEDLRPNDIAEIAKLLDPEMVVGYNWKGLANHFGFSATEREGFARSYCGGGNPALNFFMKLKTSHLAKGKESIHFLIESCRKLTRNDVVRFIESQIERRLIPGNATIHDLPDSVLEVLAAKLTETMPIIPSWKNLADLYGLSHADINLIATSIKTPNSFSPTKALFDNIRTRGGEQSIGFLMKILSEKMQRNDVVKLIETFN